MTTFTVSNASQLTTALSKASGGDTILLNKGDYGRLEIAGMKLGSQVTIRSADGNQGARFDQITIENSTNVKIDSVRVDGSNSGQGAVWIGDSSRISILNSEINGEVDNDYNRPYAGIYVRGETSGLVMANNYVHDVHRGMVFINGSANLTVTGNTVDYIQTDAFNFGSLQGAVIENNVGPTHFFPQSGDHADFMQFAGESSDLVIRGNLLLLENRFHMQGIFLNNGTFDNVLIEQNLVLTSSANGIFVQKGDNVVVQNNTVLNQPDGGADASFIRLLDGGTSRNNIFTNKSGGTVGSNVKVQYLDPKGNYYIGELFEGGASPALASITEMFDSYGTKGAHKLLNGTLGSVGTSTSTSEPVIENRSDYQAVDDSGTVTQPTGDATIRVGNTEAENLDLSGGYYADRDDHSDGVSGGYIIRTDSGTGTATGKFDGLDGKYWMDVAWLNQANGASDFAVLVNGKVVHSWTGTGGNEKPPPREIERLALTLEDGDLISLRGTRDDTERAKIDSISLIAQSGTSSSSGISNSTSTSSTGSVDGSVVYKLLGETEISGRDDTVKIENSTALQLSEATIAFSFEADTVDGMRPLVSQEPSDGGGVKFQAWINSGKLYVQFKEGSERDTLYVNDVKADTEYDMHVTFDGDEAMFYFDGALVGSRSFDGDWSDGARDLAIGAFQWTDTHAFDGTITDLMIINGAFLPQEYDYF